MQGYQQHVLFPALAALPESADPLDPGSRRRAAADLGCLRGWNSAGWPRVLTPCWCV